MTSAQQFAAYGSKCEGFLPTKESTILVPPSSLTLMYSAALGGGQGRELDEAVTRYLGRNARQEEKDRNITRNNQPTVKKRTPEIHDI
ncbi:hypothetical protein MAR_011199 [Mya arenaria]|uniref:Uncharacterized protein n=1 Tax=Mya arenaria TaxID=6604 RepID=A0ABY7FTD9_MYAAR|nr:hypothetical protein MAR_011199 [Mya arenaria]